jgi:hypothetical protein
MTKQVVIARNLLEPATWQSAYVDDVAVYLETQFARLPDHARIYHNYVTADHDVTPFDAGSIDHLQGLTGRIYVVCYPADPITLSIIAISVVLSVAIALLIPMPAVADAGAAARQGSSNNEMSQRTNKARPNARVPDIYGTVRAIPDLIAVPYSVYDNNVEIEHTVMCVGRGSYEIIDCYDDTTRITDIAGASAQFYYNGLDIVASLPIKIFGEQILDTPYQTAKSNSINGQTLRAPNDVSLVGESDIYCQAPNEIRLDDASTQDFTDTFADGDVIIFSDAGGYQISSGGYDDTIDLSGTYTVLTVTDKIITLSSPSSVNGAWTALAGDDNGKTNNSLSPKLSLNADRWVGPFVLEMTDRTSIIANFVAQQGLYKAKDNQSALSVTLEIEVTPVDLLDVATGAAETQQITLTGSGTLRDTVASTMYFTTSFTGRCQFRLRRVTETDIGYSGTIVDNVKISAVYAAREFERTVYEGMTIVRSRTTATDGALAVKERKLNALVTRQLLTYTADGLAAGVIPTNKATDAIIAACLDPYIGRRSMAEVDIAGIKAIETQITDYFGVAAAGEFSYTFDNENQSFEEIVSAMAAAVFCTAYRQGNVIKLNFERSTDDSVLLFNHRNKVPKSEKRTTTFGIENDHDGVEYTYISPDDDAKITLKVPSDSITNPKKESSVGVRNAQQAHLAAWRIWNKLRYQSESVEFEALRESDLVIRQDRVSIADNTRTGTLDGEVVAHDGLIVEMSQAHSLDPLITYTMHLQLYDGTVDAINVTAGADAHHVVLARAPTLPLVVASDRYLRTLYMITSSDDSRPKAFLIGEKSPAGRMTNTLKCVNYDARYYQNDTDFLS